MISFRKADIIDKIKPQHGNFMGKLTLIKRILRRHEMWIVPDWNYKDTTPHIKNMLQQAISDTGAEDLPVGWGWEITDDDQSPSIDDILSDLRDNMENHDLGIVRNDRGESEITITYQIQI